MNRYYLCLSYLMLTSACNSSSSQPVLPTGPNVMTVTVGSSSGLCSQNGYVNEPCTSVKICSPGTSNCQVIPDILVDTGSIGLRVFSSAMTVGLNQITDSSGGAVGECAVFGTGSTWGPLMMADVILAEESAVHVPIQVISSRFATPPSPCASSYGDPQSAGFNGILGVGVFNEDCGDGCASATNNGIYFTCNGGSCTGTAMAKTNQVQNPVSHLPMDNNGLMLQMPQISSDGVSSVTGALVLGIGTQSNNVPSGVSLYSTDAQGNFITSFNNQSYLGSFIDSGSNGLFFPIAAYLPACSASGGASGFSCPSDFVNYSAINKSATGSQLGSVAFQVGNAENLVKSNNKAFNNLAGNYSGGFDWGLPFFFGRSVYVGIEGWKSSIGTGPYWAY